VTVPWRLPLCLVLAAGTWAAAPDPAPLRWGLALFVGTAALWMTQALPLAVTALLVPVLAMLGGLQQPVQAFAPFASPIVFLFLGGLSLAAALQHQGLARAAALSVLRLAGGSRLQAACCRWR
jgi:solute carrier family 13 (sodium-dependent dicarboxylate transporter), member 2/3/5